MIIPSGFKFRLAAADILPLGIFRCNGGFINKSCTSAFAVNRARVARAVARFVRYGVVFLLQETFVVT